MRQITPEKLAAELTQLLAAAQKEPILVMRDGKPSVLLFGVEGYENYDAEDWGYMTDPEFWRMIDERRKETGGVTLEEVKARLAADEAREQQMVASKKA